MLSQRIGWSLYRISNGDGPSSVANYELQSQLLAWCIHLLESSQRALSTRDLMTMDTVLLDGGPCLRPNQHKSIELPAGRVPLDDGSVLAQVTQEAWRVAVGDLKGSEAADLARQFEGPLATLLDQFDRATLQAQSSSTAHIERLLSLNWILVFALVVGEIFLIFRPMARTVERSIQALRQSNDLLMKSEDRLKDFASVAAHQFWESDASFRLSFIAAANPQTRLVGAQASIGKRLWETEGVDEDAVDGADWGTLRRNLKDAKTVQNFEYSRAEAGFRTTWWRVNAKPVFATDGALTGYRGTQLEITGEREAAERLRVSERMTTIGQLTAGIAHDFNNILAVIQGNSELLLLEKSKELQRQNVDGIVAAVSRGSDLTSRLLSFGRVQSLSPEPIELSEFLEKLSVLLSRTLGENFTVRVRYPNNPLRVLADPSQLENAALNVSINARDAAGSAGKLWIEASAEEVVLPESILNATGGSCEFVRITFRDNGPGIPIELKDRIFEPFFTTKQVGEGSGLGLSMVHGFAHQSGGFLEVESTVNDGTSIKLFLPSTTVEPVALTVQSCDDPVRVGLGLSALLVEDNQLLREVSKRQLELLGFKVTDVGDGAEAMAVLSDSNAFDLLMLDIVLPGDIDGRDIALVALADNPRACILFCTGFFEDAVRQTACSDLPGPVLTKPASFNEVTTEIGKLVSRQRASIACK